jgi:uncharacterized surface protein with fasciclin (FAS1) repeats
MPHNIVETAREAGTFQTLLTAVDAAGLGETLADGGPFTVFAPTDDSEQKTVEGGVLEIALDGGVTVNDATVIQADVEAENGVIHVIDRVLIPAA